MQAGVLPRQRALFAAIFALLCAPFASAQKRINCPNGETHYEIDVEKLALNYQGRSFQTTLSGLGALGAKVALQPTTLQAADAATQQWNQLLQGLAAGFNRCAVTQAQYNEGLQKIYPRLKDDAAELEKIRQALANSQAVDRQRFQSILDSYFANLRRFADAGNNRLVDAIRAVVEQGATRIEGRIEESSKKLLEQVEQLKQQIANLPRPQEIKREISELKQVLLDKADEAEREYNLGYDLLQKYQFRDAIPHLRKAVGAVRLPSFFLTLSQALRALPDPADAERVSRDGLALEGLRPTEESDLANQLGLILQDKGDMAGAQRYTERALASAEKVYGPDHPTVATDANNLGHILLAKWDLVGAQRYTERALAIAEKVYGPDHPTVAIYACYLGLILQAKGDLAGAQRYLQKAYSNAEKRLGAQSLEARVYAAALADLKSKQ